MKILALFLSGLLFALEMPAQDHAARTESRPVTLVTGFGDLHHAVSTKNPNAQQFFDQGLR